MDIVLEVSGASCDLAVHPVSESTATAIRTEGRKIYSRKYMNWWRKGNTRNFGMRLDSGATVRLYVDGVEQPMEGTAFMDNAETRTGRLFLESRAKHLAVMGFTEECCTYKWIWRNVDSFDPKQFSVSLLDFHPVLNGNGFQALEDVYYEGRGSDDFEWGNPSGFTLIDPVVVDTTTVRQRLHAN